VEETPCLWVTWITEGCKRAGRPVPAGILIQGRAVQIVGVELTYGTRYYLVAPCCGRRVEAIYFLGREFGCRRCLHLGYRSQVHRPGSVWGCLDWVFDRRSPWLRWEWGDNVVMTEIVTPVRELLASKVEAMFDKLEVDDDND
jgi:hypothetical protein